jgi:HSP20 family molecular chaperone IbpA
MRSVEEKVRLSAKWRRSKKHSKWLDILKNANQTRSKKPRQLLPIRNLEVKRQAHLYTFRIPKVHMERTWREPKPLIDILEENDEIIVITEFTGFNKENLKIHVKNQKLTLSAESPERKYYKSLNLPKRVIPNKIHTKYKNGVLEIRLKKDVEEKTIDKLAG